MARSRKLVSQFGRDRNENFNRRLFNKGVFLSSPPGVPVNAVFPGDVAFSGEIDGLGNSIIIDHGDHFYSVYANVDQISVKPAGRVQAKQKIALAGSDPLRGDQESISKLDISPNHLIQRPG